MSEPRKITLQDIERVTPDVVEDKAKLDHKIETHIWLISHVLGDQFLKEPEKTRWTLGCGFDPYYVKIKVAYFMQELGFTVMTNRGLWPDLVFDWAHDPSLPSETIMPLYEKEMAVWKRIFGAMKHEQEHVR